jgi:RimJ/RimL family protein N-acetyltransferase
LSTEVLRLFTENNLAAAARLGGFDHPGSSSMCEGSRILHFIKMIENDPAQHPWLTRAVVRKRDNLMIGHIGFHHKGPDPLLLAYSRSAAELGYTIESVFRRSGYATESAVAMMEWAHHDHGIESFALSISPANEPSLRMAEAMGFRKVGEQIDEIDGLEHVMIAAIKDIRASRRGGSADLRKNLT